MEVGKLTVQTRRQFGKGSSRRLRAEGKVPGICYGPAMSEPLAISVDPIELRKSLDPVKRNNTVIDITVEDTSGNTAVTAMLRDYQIDPIRRELTHVDLLAIDINRAIEVQIPIILTGKAPGVFEGGQLHVVRHEISIICKPQDIPGKVTLDISEMQIGDVRHISDLTLPPGIEPAIPPTLTIVSCVAPKADEEEKPAEALEGEEGEEGAAPADGEAAPEAAGEEEKKPGKS